MGIKNLFPAASKDEVHICNLVRFVEQIGRFFNLLNESRMMSIVAQVWIILHVHTHFDCLMSILAFEWLFTLQMEELCMKCSRHDVYSTILKLLMDSLAMSPVPSPERIVLRLVMLIFIPHVNVGLIETSGTPIAYTLRYRLLNYMKDLRESARL